MQLLLGTLAPTAALALEIRAFQPLIQLFAQAFSMKSFVVKLLLVAKSLQQAAVNPKAGLSTPTCY